ncbi:MAG TPA: LamG domain-containing protein [Streptosporangiaceae bacterium]|nr:LamG domain-containing protein [Streptosporangiaceae bacterium]
MKARIGVGITALTLATAMVTAAPGAGAAAAGHHRTAAGAKAKASPGPNVSATALSSWQTNGLVRTLVYATGWVYAGGTFTGEMAPGASATTLSGTQPFLARFSSMTGVFDPSFSPVFSNTVNPASVAVDVVTLSPDGHTLYVGGDFTDVTIGATTSPRSYGAAFDLTTSPPTLTSWDPKANGPIRAIAPSPDGTTIYLGGAFGTLGTTSRAFAGAVDAATGGTVAPWAPVVDKLVDSIAIAPGGSAVLIGGFFSTFNGVTQQGIGSTDATTGTTVNPWPNILPSGQLINSQVTDIIVGPVSTAHPDGTAYVAVQGLGTGNFDGDYAVDIKTGAELWENDCFGDTQGLLILGGWLYKASHADDCSYAPGGFPPVIAKTGVKLAHHLLDQSLTNGSLGFWNPNTNGGPVKGDLGPYAFATDGSTLFVGGDFSQVNSKQQEGFAIFPAKPAKGKDSTAPTTPAAPIAVSTSAGTDSVRVTGVSDRDDGTLTYSFYRDGKFIGARTMVSWPWAVPVVHYRDAGLKAGKTHYYSVRVCDPSGDCSAFSPHSSTVKVRSMNPLGYFSRVLADKPSFLWGLGETSGSTAFDAAKHGYRGSYEPGTTKGIKSDPIGGTKATVTAFTGGTTSGGLVTAKTKTTSPTTFSIELWFKTSTSTGGELAGFSSSQTGGAAASFDRQIWMTNDGHLAFGVNKSSQTALSADAYNDGQWHYVVATFSPKTGLALYVDGVRAAVNSGKTVSSYPGYWRVGGGDLNGWSLDTQTNARPATAPNDYFITGDIADFAVYPKVLIANQVAMHWAANYLSH